MGDVEQIRAIKMKKGQFCGMNRIAANKSR